MVRCEISGVVSISHAISGSIKNSDQIVGVVTCPISAGGITDYYEGAYDVVPKPDEKQILSTANKIMQTDITVFEIPYYSVSNNSGETVYIGKELEIND